MLAIKGFAILIIMLTHIGEIFGIRYLTPFGSLGVAIFLFCSGFGLEKSFHKKGLRGFWRKRIITAYFPYLIFEAFGYLFLYESVSLKSVVLDLLFIDPMHPFGWYMQCLFLYYAAFWIASLIEKNVRLVKYALLLSCALLMFLFFRSLFKQQLLSFIMGVCVANASEKFNGFIKRIGFAVLFLFIGLTTLGLRQFDAVRGMFLPIYSLIEVIQCTALAIGCIALMSIVVDKVKPYFYQSFMFLGLISFDLYLIHAFTIPKHANFVSIFVFFAVSFLISGVVHMARFYISIFFSERMKNVKNN